MQKVNGVWLMEMERGGIMWGNFIGYENNSGL